MNAKHAANVSSSNPLPYSAITSAAVGSRTTLCAKSLCRSPGGAPIASFRVHPSGQPNAVFFENKPDAGAPAHEVRITDRYGREGTSAP